MAEIIQKFKSLNRPYHFILYCITFMFYAMAMTGVGPLIPYLSQQTGRKQTYYSFLIFCKSIGFFTGSILLKRIKDKLVFHRIMMICLIVLFIFMTLISVTLDLILQGLIMIVIATMISIINILMNLCVVKSQNNGDVHFWMLILHGTYGIGGLLGPMIIYQFEVHSFLIFGILLGALVPFYYNLSSPQVNDKMLKLIVSSQLFSFQTYDQTSPGRNTKKKYISTKSQHLLCFIFWAYIGIELGFANWISSYAVMEGVDTKQSALRYNEYFWIFMTVFRFISLLLPWRSMRILIANQYMLIGCVTYSILLIFQHEIGQACIFSSISFGISFSSMYPLLLSAPTDYNLQISATQMTYVALFSALGELIISPIFGLLMDWFTYNMFFYIILLMGIVLIISTHLLEQRYEQDCKITTKSSINLKEILLTDDSITKQ